MNLGLKDRVAVVAASSQGIGRAAIKHMQRRRWGRIITLTSITAKQLLPCRARPHSLAAEMCRLRGRIMHVVERFSITQLLRGSPRNPSRCWRMHNRFRQSTRIRTWLTPRLPRHYSRSTIAHAIESFSHLVQDYFQPVKLRIQNVLEI
jgi:hypothetical protein